MLHTILLSGKILYIVSAQNSDLRSITAGADHCYFNGPEAIIHSLLLQQS